MKEKILIFFYLSNCFVVSWIFIITYNKIRRKQNLKRHGYGVCRVKESKEKKEKCLLLSYNPKVESSLKSFSMQV